MPARRLPEVGATPNGCADASTRKIGRLRMITYPDMYGTLRNTYEVIASEVRIINK